MKLRGIMIMIISGLWTAALMAQMAGNPVETRGKGEWTISASGSYSRFQLPNKTAENKFLLKSAWGITPWLDMYAMGGVAKLGMEYSDFTDYEDKYRLAYGLGFTLSAPEDSTRQSMRLWGGAQLLRFESEGSIQKVNLYMIEEHELKYDQREFVFYGGIKMPFHRIRFYAAGIGYVLNRDEKMKVYLVQDDDKVLQKKESGGYQSDLQTGGLAGIEFDLPRRYAVTLEGLFFNETNYQIMIGICQTGQQ
jgi:hypothetical protein